MKLVDLIGKVVVRTAAVREPSIYGHTLAGMGSERIDSSYTTTAIKVEGHHEGVVFYRDRPLGQLHIMDPRFCDNAWTAIPENLVQEFWKEPGVAEKAPE